MALPALPCPTCADGVMRCARQGTAALDYAPAARSPAKSGSENEQPYDRAKGGS